MYKLVSNIDGSKWSYLNGRCIFDEDVLMLDTEDIHKYVLIDGDGNRIDINVKDCLIKIN